MNERVHGEAVRIAGGGSLFQERTPTPPKPTEGVFTWLRSLLVQIESIHSSKLDLVYLKLSLYKIREMHIDG